MVTLRYYYNLGVECMWAAYGCPPQLPQPPQPPQPPPAPRCQRLTALSGFYGLNCLYCAFYNLSPHFGFIIRLYVILLSLVSNFRSSCEYCCILLMLKVYDRAYIYLKIE